MDEILRYMRIPPSEADDKLKYLISGILDELVNASAPRYIIKETENTSVFESESLSAHLYDCEKIYLFAATLGTGTDTVIRKYLKTDILKASAAQAAATYLIEKYCDEITASLKSGGLYPKPRFSPGYGDFSLKHQALILKLLDAEKRLGITLTESLMMLPAKSVTAVIGLTRKQYCITDKCRLCKKEDCQFRKED